jgi:hypothetical protein
MRASARATVTGGVVALLAVSTKPRTPLGTAHVGFSHATKKPLPSSSSTMQSCCWWVVGLGICISARRLRLPAVLGSGVPCSIGTATAFSGLVSLHLRVPLDISETPWCSRRRPFISCNLEFVPVWRLYYLKTYKIYEIISDKFSFKVHQ